MRVSYTQEQKDQAKKEGKVLATIAVHGILFQEPIPEAEARTLTRYVIDLQDRLEATAAAKKASSCTTSDTANRQLESLESIGQSLGQMLVGPPYPVE